MAVLDPAEPKVAPRFDWHSGVTRGGLGDMTGHGGIEGPPTHFDFELSPSRPVGLHAVPCMPPVMQKFGHLWIGLVSVLLVPQCT